MQTKHDLGQYFTTNLILKRQVFDFIKNEPKLILEPSIGQGDLVQYISSQKPHINFDMFEIDTKIKLLKNITRENINYGDFMGKEITKKYKTIVGNPPYVRTKKGNLYIDFTKKCFNLLKKRYLLRKIQFSYRKTLFTKKTKCLIEKMCFP